MSRSVRCVAEETGGCRTAYSRFTTKAGVGVWRCTVGLCAVGCCDTQTEVGVVGARCSGSEQRVVSQTAVTPETSRWIVRVRNLTRHHIIQIHARRCCLARCFSQKQPSIALVHAHFVTLFFNITEWTEAHLSTRPTSIRRIANESCRTCALDTPARTDAVWTTRGSTLDTFSIAVLTPSAFATFTRCIAWFVIAQTPRWRSSPIWDCACNAVRFGAVCHVTHGTKTRHHQLSDTKQD